MRLTGQPHRGGHPERKPALGAPNRLERTPASGPRNCDHHQQHTHDHACQHRQSAVPGNGPLVQGTGVGMIKEARRGGRARKAQA